ncbi:flagellar protein [Planococcus plakortidis]|uniref:flagellar protein n=1 Tax=Planococcus plakortidis TaxID=1038856 RepID=UPI0012EDDE27|nr:flagellar protein [Planococcus plakortidis]
MNNPQLDNCPSCGALYLRDQIDCCLNCYQANEAAFKKVDVFLKNPDYRNASIEDVHAFTDVSINKIAEFLRGGRIIASDYPNLGYPCAHCGELINRQMLCEACHRAFKHEVGVIMSDAESAETVDKQRAVSAQYWKMKK